MEGVFFSFAGSTRLEVCSSGSRPHLPVALSDSVSYRLGSDFYPSFEDVATQLSLGTSLQRNLKYIP